MLSATVFEQNNIGYFFGANGKVDRYDINQEKWLAPIQLIGASAGANAALVDNDGIYAAYGTAVYRYNLDGTGQTQLFNALYTVSALHSDGNLLFVNYSGGLYARFTSVNKTTNTLIDSIEQYVYSVNGSSIAPEVNKIFGRSEGVSPADITFVSYADDGRFTGGGDSPYHGDYWGGEPAWVFPGGAKVTDTSGNVYSTDSLTRLNSFGSTITDIDFVGGTIPVVLSGASTLTAYTQGLLPTGNATLSNAASEIFVNDNSVIAFRADGASATGYTAEIVPLTRLSAPQPGQPLDPIGLPYTPDKIVQATNGTVLIFSKAQQSVFTWNPVSQSYSNTIPLIGIPDFMSYSPTNNTIYFAYTSGLIRKIDLNAATPTEVPFANLPSRPGGLATAGPYVFAEDGSGAWATHYTFAPDGTQISAVDWNYYSSEYVWSAANQKMYFFRDDTSPNDLLWESIGTDGTLGMKIDSPLHDSSGFYHPIRVSPDGTIVVLGSGVVHDGTTLARKTTALANPVSDIAWLGSTMYTIRSIGGVSQIQQWLGSTFAAGLVKQLPGTPVALLAVASDRLLAVTMNSNGVPSYQELDGSLNVVTRPAPIADAGADATAFVGQTITLSGANSTDPDGGPNPLTYQWITTSGPAVVIVGNPNTVTPSFRSDVPGTFILTLTVSDGVYTNSDTVTVRVRTNAAPTADVSRSVSTAVIGRAPASLDGTASTDPDGDTLAYAWRIIAGPAGSNATINNPSQSIAGLVATAPGAYTIELKVSDGVLTDTKTFTVTANNNHAPNADATQSDPTGVAGRRNATLRGSLSSDPDADTLTYQWKVIASPAGSSPTISNSTSATAALAANVPGTYTVELKVSDGLLSDTDQFVVTMGANRAPIANATASQTNVIAGGPAAGLDGRRSVDPDGDTLFYSWKVVASTNGALPTISNPTKSTAQLSAATAGSYVVQLTVGDGLASDTDFVIVTVRGNQAPIADVSLSDKVVMLGKSARLDATKSFDPDGDSISFTWTVVATSNGYLPTIENANSPIAGLVTQAVGYYAVELTARDAVAVDTEYLLITVNDNPGVKMGDFDANGYINQADYAIWRQTFGSSSDLRADANHNGAVDAADILAWRKHQGLALSANAEAFAVVTQSHNVVAPQITAELAIPTQGTISPSNVRENKVDSVMADWPKSVTRTAFQPRGRSMFRLDDTADASTQLALLLLNDIRRSDRSNADFFEHAATDQSSSDEDSTDELSVSTEVNCANVIGV